VLSSLLPEVEGWIKVTGALVAVLMALLVPIRSWITEDRRYRAQTLEAISAASRHAVSGVTTTASTMLADALTLAALADALNRVAAAIERLVEAEEDRDKDRLTRALDRFLDLHRPDHGP